MNLKQIIRGISWKAVAFIFAFLTLSYITADLMQERQRSNRAPQEKVQELANEIKHENSAACVVLFMLSVSMLTGDEKRLASMMGIYAQFMKDSLEGKKD